MAEKQETLDMARYTPQEGQAVEKSAHLEGERSEELGQLLEAHSVLLAELNVLQKEHAALLRRETDAQERLHTLTKENADLKSKLSAERGRVQEVLHQLEQVQRKYNALSQSKLGRLTLYHWARQAKKNGSKSIASLPPVEKFFSRIPSADQLQAELELASGPEELRQVTEINIDKAALEAWVSSYDEALDTMPDSNGSRYYQKLSYRVGIICDEFFYESICDAAQFVYLTPDNWTSIVAEGQIDVLLFVSAWRGLNEEWTGIATFNSNKRKIAMALLDACRERNIPIIFYSKEDPPNYERYIDYARKSDYIFTSAAECIPYYIEDCENKAVASILFGVNPSKHNPIGFYRPDKERTVLFSGSWMKRYPRRCKEVSVIFDGVLRSNYALHIIDRNYGNERYQYPVKYLGLVSPAVEHTKLQKLHKLFDWAINVNSVTGSETMFANRTFELQAGGVLLLSNYSVGVNSVHPTVFMAHESFEVDRILDGFSKEELYEHQIAGIRSVMTGHTCYDRITELLAPMGVDAAQPVRRVLVLADELSPSVEEGFARQTYPEKTMCLQSELTEQMLSEYDMVTWFSEDARYGAFYLEDMINGFKYTACNYITKDAWIRDERLNAGTEHGYVDQMKSRYRTVFWREAYDAAFFLAPPEAQPLPNGYSADHFSYREGEKKVIPRTTPYKLSVVVPVYNNGRHLYGKCFASLRRSTLFEDMEILLVDDGSTDLYTLRIEDELAEQYPNVTRFCFGDGGSGSASRPRNKGVELATADYVTFLDPDNEAICDGYAALYQQVTEESLDVAFGNIYRWTDSQMLFNYYSNIKSHAGETVFTDGMQACIPKTDFLAVSIQAMVIRRSILTDNHLEQVLGAAGQDTLFCWQIFSAARRLRVIDLPIHIYYAQTSGSVTNSVKPGFFRKFLLLQQPKIDWLVKNNLIRDYMERRHDVYTRGWIFKKLAQAQEPEECTRIVERVLQLYAPYYRNTDELINSFLALCSEEDYMGAFHHIQEAFPEHRTRPMPTAEEIQQAAVKSSKLDIVYHQENGSIRLLNQVEKESTTSFAWVVLLNQKRYRKVFGTEYSSEPNVTIDFTAFGEGNYKVRAFILSDKGEKQSEDVLFVKVNGQKEIIVDETRTTAIEV